MHILFFIYSVVFVFRTEERLVAILVYTSFRRVVTSMLRRISVFKSSDSKITQAVLKWGVNTEWLRIQHSNAAKHSERNDCDVTRLVATERVRNR